MDECGKRIFTITDSTDNEKSQTPFDEEHFRQIYFYEPPPKQSLADKVKKQCKCNRQLLLDVFPILKWLRTYKKKDVVSDVIAGLTVAVMHIPQGMAYALLGGVPPVVGIYMAFFPVLMYILLGTSRHVSMGTFAVVCMMVGKSVDTYSYIPEGNSTIISPYQNSTTYTPTEVATAVCLVVGIWQVFLSILRLGSLSVLLSQTLVSGFTTGAAVHVLTSQIRNLLGIKVKRYSGPLKIIYTYRDIFVNITNLNVLATTLSACFIVFLVVFNEFIKPFVQKKMKRTVPIPVELIVVIIGTVISQSFDMKENYGVAIVDYVPTGLPEPSVPPINLLPSLVMDGLVIAIVAISINISMATIFAQKLGYEIDGNQEILASGVGNIFSSFFSCMPFAASLSRSLIQESAGGKTQLTSMVSSLTLVLVLLFIAHFFEPLPYCVLSTIIVVALKGMFKQIGELPQIYKNSALDGLVWVTSFISVVVLDIDYGLGIGLIASVLSILYQSQNTRVVTLGRLPNIKTYVEMTRFKKAQGMAHVLVLQVIGGLHFANCNSVRRKIGTLFSSFSKSLPVGFLSSEKQAKCLSLIIDLSCVPFVDPSAIKSLMMVYDDVKSLQSNLLVCGCLASVYESLERSQDFEKFPKQLVFHSVHDAVEYAKKLESRFYSEAANEYISMF